MIKPFAGEFTQQEAISEEAINSAIEVLRSGRLHRYNTIGNELSEVSLLEQEYASYQGAKYCLACASGGYALSISLRAAGLKLNEPVLTNSFTLAPVPGAIASVGGCPILVETTKDLVMDLDDLEAKVISSGARFLLLSHMRGHIVDMDCLAKIVDANNLIMIEDCAHTMGAKWRSCKSGNFGIGACFSTQTYKHINSGEGGIITSNDAEFMARAIILSGSYMLYEKHSKAPSIETFKKIRLETPNCSGRMDNLRATILRPQLVTLNQNIKRWNELYKVVEQKISNSQNIQIVKRKNEEYYVGSSFQFMIYEIPAKSALRFVEANKKLGVELKWFGNDEPIAFTSNHKSWHYIENQNLPKTDLILSSLFDLRLPLSFTLEDCAHIGDIIVYCAQDLAL